MPEGSQAQEDADFPRKLEDADPSAEIFERLNERGMRPVRSFLIWLGGGDRVLLPHAPTEDRVFTVLGSSVVLTSIIAALLGCTTAGFLIYGYPTLRLETVAGGALCGLIVASIDHILVKAQLNPYMFPSVFTNALVMPSADSATFARVSQVATRASFGQRIVAGLGVLRRVSIRLAIALCTSYLFSQAALFYFFSDEVEARAQFILDGLRSETLSSLNQTYRAQRAALQTQLDSYDGTADVQVVDLDGQISELETTVGNLRSDLSTAGQLVGAERDGPPIQCFVFLSDFAPDQKCTSGEQGTTGGQYEAAVLLRDSLDTALQSQTSALNELKSQRQSRLDALAAVPTTMDAVAQLQSSISSLDTDYASESLGIATGRSDDVTGILIRHEALGQLEEDRTPETPEIDKPPPCSSGLTGILCRGWRLFFQPTPLGSFVGAFKLLFLAIELLPIILKVSYSLRLRRPYDEFEAALEESSSANAVELLDSKLIQTGALLEGRAAWRRARRGASGAEFYLTERRDTPDYVDVGPSWLSGESLAGRRRLWPRRSRRSSTDEG